MRSFSYLLLLALLGYSLSFSQRVDKHVILVEIDGARYTETLGDPSHTRTPNFHRLAAQGAVVDSCLNEGETVTRRALPALWTGSYLKPRDTTIGWQLTQYTVVPTVWEYCRKELKLDSTHVLHVMTERVGTSWLASLQPGYGRAYWPWEIKKGDVDFEVWHTARQMIAKYHPTLMVLYLADVDAAPQQGGWYEYLHAIEIADQIVGELWDFVQSDSGMANKTTLIVTNDHGRHSNLIPEGFLSHGDDCYGCQHIMLLAIGPPVKRGFHLNAKKSIVDITPTIGKILGFPTPMASGRPITEILVNSPGGK